MKNPKKQNLKPVSKSARKGRRTSRENYTSTKSTKHIESINPAELKTLLHIDAWRNQPWLKPRPLLPIDLAVNLLINPQDRDEYDDNASEEIPRTSSFIIRKRLNIDCPFEYARGGLWRAFMAANTVRNLEEYQKIDFANKFKDIAELSDEIISKINDLMYLTENGLILDPEPDDEIYGNRDRAKISISTIKNALGEFDYIAKSAAASAKKRRRPGAGGNIWHNTFVSHTAGVWAILTGTEPSANRYFKEYVTASYSSLYACYEKAPIIPRLDSAIKAGLKSRAERLAAVAETNPSA